MTDLDGMMIATGIDHIREEHLIGTGLTHVEHLIEMIGIDHTRGEHSIETKGTGIGIETEMTRMIMVGTRTDENDHALENVPVVHLLLVQHLYRPLLHLQAQLAIIQHLLLLRLHPLRHL